MALSRAKYKRLPDLYVTGKEVVFEDGTVMWMQVLNPLERDEAQHDAQVARSRLIMALKHDVGSDERTAVQAAFLEDGRDAAIDRLVDAKAASQLWKSVEAIKNDPDWQERLEIMERTSELLARPMEDVERKLLEQINLDYIAEVEKAQTDERDYLRRHHSGMTDDQLVEEYIELYLDRRGNDVAGAEFALTEVWFAARCCDGQRSELGEWDHSRCDQHDLRVYETKAEVRALPEAIQDLLGGAMVELNMQVREAKNSDRQGSSSGSSPLPSAEEESTLSIPAEIPVELPGISSSPSAMASVS